MFFIVLIFFLISSTESMITAFSPTKTPHNWKTKQTLRTFSARLIHRSSPDFPFYNPNYTRYDYIKDSIRTSIARSRYFSQIKARSATDYVAAPIDGYMMYMQYTMGTPPVHRYGALDTASDLIWFQCLPCVHCYNQNNQPIYDPKKSSSYRKVSCKANQCSFVAYSSCVDIDSTSICQYFIRYFDGTESRGILSMDILTLSADNTSETLENAVFGCATDNQASPGFPGIVGLSNKAASLHNQLGLYHFSYYVSAKGTDISGEVHFGPGASLSSTGANTPILPSENGFYYLNLTGISVDGSDLDLPSDYFERNYQRYYGGVMIDSGTYYTTLPNEAFEKLKQAIADEMYMFTQEESVDKALELCYKDYDVSKGGAPEVVFQFSGLDFAVCDSNLWLQTPISKLFCLAIFRNNYGSKGVIGLYQQRNVQVGYDLEKNLLTLNSPEVCPDKVIDFIQ